MSYKRSIGQPYIYPRNDLGYAENFLSMMFAVPAEPYICDQDVADALEMLLILHADHEQNCSASTVRMVGSSHLNLFGSISAGITALWGPRHGGANQEVVQTLLQISESDDDIDASSRGPRIPRTRSACRVSVTASTRTTTRGRGSSRTPPTRSSASWSATTRCSMWPTASKRWR